MQYWWVPFSVAVVLLGLIALSQLAGKDRFRRRIASYRKSYLDLVKKLERQTIILNRLAPALSEFQDHKLLDLYESSIRLFENLLTLVTSISPFGQDRFVLDSAHFLQRDFDGRLKVLETALKQKHSPQTRHALLDDLQAKPFPLGCFFCSRPFIYSGLTKVKAKVEGRTQQVYSCKICRDELTKERKVRILYFLKDDKPVHWSQVKEYNPVNDFWDLHRKNVVMKPTKLELIYTRDPSDPLS